MTVHAIAGGVYDVSAGMGRARVGPAAVALDPAALGADGRMRRPGGDPIRVVPVSVGNPHMVVLDQPLDEDRLGTVGPFLVGHPALAAGANVQLAEPDGRDACRALIWERGVGPTSASGTSACAVSAALVSSGHLDPGAITVRMPGGAMQVTVSEDLDVTLRAPVEEVCEGVMAPNVPGPV